MARVSVFGLGYVGSVTAGCLAADGHEVVGVDVNEDKLDSIRRGRSPMAEKGLDGILAEAIEAGRLRVTSDADEAVAATDISLVCVGTPSNRNGSLDLAAIENVVTQIGSALKASRAHHVVVMRSTVLPGTAREVVIPLLERTSGRSAGVGFGYVSNPEFLREGSAVADFRLAELTVIGATEPVSARAVESIYEKVDTRFVRVDIDTAEMIKYANNAFHALKVAFANEIGTVARRHGVDGRRVMDILAMDRKLNISPAYLRPGFAFGGSCLPKDLRALVYQSGRLDLQTPLLSSILPSNETQVQRAIEAVEASGAKQIGVLGLAFKAGTDDVRESPAVRLIETLIGRGFDVRVYDDEVQLGKLTGANKAFLQAEIPHIATLMSDSLEDVMASSDVLVVTNQGEGFAGLGERMAPDQTVIDLAGAVDTDRGVRGTYLGSGW
ncbi:MAG: nucleotide sugar dehydrogenase [Actinomycetota bacterium]